MELVRITTQYVDVQDRILLVGEASDGTREEFWLTQRLLIRIVPVLTGWLAKSENGPAPQAVNAFKQSSAVASLKRSEPVQRDARAQCSLVLAVDVSFGAARVRLKFRADDREDAVITLSRKQLRQWVGIIYGAYKKAGWSLSSWPDWMIEEAAPTQRHVSLH